MPEWLKGTDCKSVGARLRWFKSNPLHHTPRRLGPTGERFAMKRIGTATVVAFIAAMGVARAASLPDMIGT